MERRKFLELALKGTALCVLMPLGCGDGTTIQGGPVTSYSVGDNLKAWNSVGNEYLTKPLENIIEKIAADGQVAWRAGGLGQADGKLNFPEKTGFDDMGAIYVLDSGNSRLSVFDETGGFLYNIGSYGQTGAGLNFPRDMVITANDIIYVANSYNHTVNIYTTNGDFAGNIGSFGSGAGELNAPRSLAVDTEGNIHVIDLGSCTIKVFTGQGGYAGHYGAWGAGEGQFMAPTSIVIDGAGYSYIADRVGGHISIFNSRGAYYSRFQPTLDNQAYLPSALAWMPDGALYIRGVLSPGA